MKQPAKKKIDKTHDLINNTRVLKRPAMDMNQLRQLRQERRREARIKSAINKGKQTLLPNQSEDIKLSKFEHNGKDGPLVVFAEELSYPFGNFGNYKIVKKSIPSKKGYNDNIRPTAKQPRANVWKPHRGLMLSGEPESGSSTTSNLSNNSSFDGHHGASHKDLKLPKLKSAPLRQDEDQCRGGNYGDQMSNLELSRNTELPKLPAQEYVDNFRKDAVDFERSLMAGKTAKERRVLKGKTRDNSILPRIDEKSSLFLTNTDKVLNKDDNFRLPKLQLKKEVPDGMMETASKKKRKARNGEQKRTGRLTRHNTERKVAPAAQKEQTKWCKITMQSNAYI